MQVEFRDGKREIPDYLGEMMAGLDTVRMTYEEAVEAANQQTVRNHLNRVMDQTISGHMANWKRGT